MNVDPNRNVVVFVLRRGSGEPVLAEAPTRDDDCIEQAWEIVRDEHRARAAEVAEIHSEWQPSPRDAQFIGRSFPGVTLTYNFGRPTDGDWAGALAAARRTIEDALAAELAETAEQEAARAAQEAARAAQAAEREAARAAKAVEDEAARAARAAEQARREAANAAIPTGSNTERSAARIAAIVGEQARARLAAGAAGDGDRPGQADDPPDLDAILNSEAFEEALQDLLSKADEAGPDTPANDPGLLPVLCGPSSSRGGTMLKYCVRTPFVPDVIDVAFAQVAPTPNGTLGLDWLTVGGLRSSGGPPEADLLALASGNIIDGLTYTVRVFSGVRTITVQREGGMGASAVVLPDFYVQMCALLGADRLVVGIPTPEVLFVAAADGGAAPSVTAAVMESTCEETFLGPTVLEMTPDGIRVLDQRQV